MEDVEEEEVGIEQSEVGDWDEGDEAIQPGYEVSTPSDGEEEENDVGDGFVDNGEIESDDDGRATDDEEFDDELYDL